MFECLETEGCWSVVQQKDKMMVTAGTSVFGILLQLLLQTSGKFPQIYFNFLIICGAIMQQYISFSSP
jgi:hypothetical protein